ncbi:MAG: EamA family transporter [Oscillospiraceae bacterium]
MFTSIIQHKESKAQGKTQLFKAGATALIFPIIFSMMDGLETIVSGVCLDQTFGYAMPVDDSVIIIGIEYGIFALGFWIYVSVKEKHVFNPFTKSNAPFAGGALCDNVAIVFYANAMSSNAVATDPILAVYPAITILLSRMILKEKLPVKQYLSLGLMLVGSILIVLGENVWF